MKYIVIWIALRIMIIPCDTQDIFNPYSIGPPPYYNGCTHVVKDSFALQFSDKNQVDSFLRKGMLRRDVDTMYVQIDTSGKLEDGKIYLLNSRNKK